MERQRGGVEALRAWLAGNAAGSGRTRASAKWPRIVSWVAFAAAALAALAAYIQDALVALAGTLVALIAVGFALFLQRGRRPTAPPSTDEAMRRFHESDLAPPPQWNEQAVRKHLREVIEVRLNELTLQQTRAAGLERIRLQIREADAEIERLEEERTALANETGFDPRLPVAEFQRFIHLCSDWDKARTRHLQQGARLELLDREIAEAANLVRDFLGPWRAADAPALEAPAGQPDMILLRGAFDDLQQRNDAARDARQKIRTCETDIRTLAQRIAELDNAEESLFAQARVEPRDREALAGRIEQLPQWKEARNALHAARTEEALVRARLEEQPDLIALVDEGERARLQANCETSTLEADEHTSLIQQQTEIKTRLNDAGKDRKLEQAAAQESQAKQALEDKHDKALLAVATRTLLDDVERAFEAEHEPAVLRLARDVFAEVTARAFDLRLRGDGTFIAHDVRQETARALAELSSGTRMQLLLALRLAWIETQEQGGEALPLFLDEALTTSDEERFAVMARSLERLTGPRKEDGARARSGSGDGSGTENGIGYGVGYGAGIGTGVGTGSRSGHRVGTRDSTEDEVGDRSEGGAGIGTGGGAGDRSGHRVGTRDGTEDEAGDRSEGGAGIGTGGGAGDRSGHRVGTRDGTEDEAADRSEGGAGSGRRQIFYLSARRHEPALWQQATGAKPAVIDLAAVRFPSEASAPEDYRVETPPSLPTPDSRSAETYASLLGVPPRLDPHRPEGGIHLFHLLRDDLTLLHTLMDTWRIGTLGQLEILLASDAARAALPGNDLHRRLRQRCRVVRTWVELWRQGRGRPVDRGALEQCPAISSTFIDRVADLAARLQGDGEALLQALRAGEVDRFQTRKIDELALWLADEGHTDDQERLTGEGRRRLTLQRAAPGTEFDAGDGNRVVSWLEAPEPPADP